MTVAASDIKTTGRGHAFVFIAAAISALGGMLFGYDTGVISSAILFIKKEFMLSSTLEEITVSAVLAGAVLGAFFGGKLADYFGRRKTIITAAIIFAVGSIWTAISPNIATLIAGRIFVGVAIGVASFTAPMYISEVSPPKVRGELVSLNQLAVTIGIVLSYLVGYGLAQSGNWRGMLAFAAIPAAVLGIGMFFMPSSPRWLISHSLVDKAKEVLRRIRKTQDVDSEISEVQQSLNAQGGSWKELLGPFVRPALIVGVGLAILQQVTGINTVIYYAPTIFQSAGFKSASSAILATVGVGIVNVIMTVVAMQLVDRIGRRPLLLIGLAGMTSSLAFLGLSFKLTGLTDVIGAIAAGSLMLYVGSFAIGMGPVFWLLISEIYPLKVRGIAMSSATVFNWGSNLLVGITFLTLINRLGRPATFWLYATLSIGTWLFVWFFVPETKGKTLEEIEAHWRKGGHPLELGN
ncbi:MAG: sugar porter family MFS transporter [Candidatus Omnitrophota bacterium]